MAGLARKTALLGAAARVLLPLGLAFNVLAVRSRASGWWMVAGNLSVLSGGLALRSVPADPQEISDGRMAHGTYVAHSDKSWYLLESGERNVWAWNSGRGAVRIDIWPRTFGSRQV